MLTEKFDKNGYNITEKFMSAKKANLLSLAVLLPIFVIGVAVYVTKWDYAKIFDTLLNYYYSFLIEILILGIGVFLFIAAGMIVKMILLAVFSEGKMNSVKFKIINEIQKPYCCLAEPIKIWQYQVSLAVYILTAGIAPYFVALLMGDFIFILASFICVFFTGMDILFLIILFGKKKNAFITDFDGVMLYRIYEKI